MPTMSFVGPGEYDDVVVEIDCSPAFKAVVRNEGGKYLIEVFNCRRAQVDDFALGRKVAENSTELDEFLHLISVAKAELAYQSPRELGSEQE
jgi:hypothetical protein